VAGDLDLFKRFDRYDKKTLNEYLNKAKKCIKKWNFSCAEDALAKAGKYVSSKRDKEKIKQMKRLMFNELLRKAENCIKRWDFSCGAETLGMASKYSSSKEDKKAINNLYSYMEREMKRKKELERSSRALSNSFTIEKGYEDNEYRIKFSDGRTGYIYVNLEKYSDYYYYYITVWGNGLRNPRCSYSPDTERLKCPYCVDTYVKSLSEALRKVVQCAIK